MLNSATFAANSNQHKILVAEIGKGSNMRRIQPITFIERILRDCFRRNWTSIKVVTASLSSVIFISGFVTLLAFTLTPPVISLMEAVIQSERSYIAIPPPSSEALYHFIFLNNSGAFWNPPKMIVWAPFVGLLVLGLDLILNGIVLGAIAVWAGVTYGVVYPIFGLTPHGILEIPAFILQFASIIVWQQVSIKAILTKLGGRNVDMQEFKQGLKDALTLAALSILLFALAAYIETYITPHLLEIVRH